ncbi:sigma factor-like helix-turn-helix DNA-binding protein [Alicyclobacillus mengziensis]|uniref:RNA polymerase sigma factor 70 region 4 type 2 domain-containing protein n=1 Tax=Alicyclobacillus mengziensis TaxID=2931921 RepID=A0A9X7Z605_9BACL|nr:sigma factor-like helix-turn-helix DNA-binding protein [Alicyclobacillus mengziensis]QSO47464.1 hypothetical protein JZ786_24290 [Alicyclobacillus mengziensis]
MINGVMRLELDELAVQAKTSDKAFNELLRHIKSSLAPFINKYHRSWHSVVERDELEQWVLIEFWNAVRSYDPDGIEFDHFWKLVVAKHIQTRLRRFVYGKQKRHELTAIRFDFLDGADESENEQPSLRRQMGRVESAEYAFLRSDLRQRLEWQLEQTMTALTELEKACVKLVYFEDHSYAETQRALELHSRKPVDNALARAKRKLLQNATLRQLYIEL